MSLCYRHVRVRVVKHHMGTVCLFEREYPRLQFLVVSLRNNGVEDMYNVFVGVR